MPQKQSNSQIHSQPSNIPEKIYPILIKRTNETNSLLNKCTHQPIMSQWQNIFHQKIEVKVDNRIKIIWDKDTKGQAQPKAAMD